MLTKWLKLYVVKDSGGTLIPKTQWFSWVSSALSFSSHDKAVAIRDTSAGSKDKAMATWDTSMGSVTTPPLSQRICWLPIVKTCMWNIAMALKRIYTHQQFNVYTCILTSHCWVATECVLCRPCQYKVSSLIGMLLIVGLANTHRYML